MNIEVEHEGTHIKFVKGPPKPKTKTWYVLSKYDSLLGQIGWFGRWRRYAFYPSNDTIFDEVCMREISDFIEAQTVKQKAIAKARSSGLRTEYFRRREG